jgi:DNA-binding beta-propeller fold protein YncE
MLRRVVAAVLIGSATLAAGCSSGNKAADDLLVTDNPVAATPAGSPPAARLPAGTLLPLRGPIVSMAADPRTRTLAVATGDSVLLYRLDDLTAAPRPVALPAAPYEVRLAADGGPFLVSMGSTLVRIALPSGDPTPVPVEGGPVSAAQLGGQTLVAVRDRRQVAVLDGAAVRRVITGNLFSADQVLAAGDRAVVIDRLRNGLFELDVPAGTIKQGLRAGDGATNAVTDRYGRVLVADTRGGALLAFSLDPLLMRQRYPVGGAPYGIAYDPERDLVWVTLTATNEVVGYQVAGEEPRERYRFPTVTQPNSVTVDPANGRVLVGSASAEGIQVISL